MSQSNEPTSKTPVDRFWNKLPELCTSQNIVRASDYDALSTKLAQAKEQLALVREELEKIREVKTIATIPLDQVVGSGIGISSYVKATDYQRLFEAWQYDCKIWKERIDIAEAKVAQMNQDSPTKP